MICRHFSCEIIPNYVQPWSLIQQTNDQLHPVENETKTFTNCTSFFLEKERKNTDQLICLLLHSGTQ